MATIRPLHPVLHFQPLNAAEVVGVACHHDEVFLQCGGGDEHVHIANLHAFAFQLPSYFAILLQFTDGVLLEELHDFNHVFKVLDAPRLIGAKLKLGQCDVRNLALVYSHFPELSHHIRLLLDDGNTGASVQQIFTVCKHSLPCFNVSCHFWALPQFSRYLQWFLVASPVVVKAGQCSIKPLVGVVLVFTGKSRSPIACFFFLWFIKTHRTAEQGNQLQLCCVAQVLQFWPISSYCRRSRVGICGNHATSNV